MREPGSTGEAKGDQEVGENNAAVSRSSGGPCKARPAKPLGFQATHFTVLQANVGNNRGFLLTKAELEAHLQLLDTTPTFVGLTETLLNEGTKDTEVQLTGYTLVSRRDRKDGRKGGGVALFVKNEHKSCVNLLKHSEDSERSWHLVHTGHGPVLLGLWYRPPARGEVHSISTLEAEWETLEGDCVGTVLVGDMNVHHVGWLAHSTGTTPEGSALYNFCVEHGLEEKVGQPTREGNLLDLVLTDMAKGVVCKVLPKLEDHALVLATVALGVPTEYTEQRERWVYTKANWKGLKKALKSTDWSFLDRCADTNAAQDQLTAYILQTARRYIPVETNTLKKSTHPWMNDRCLALVAAKRAAEGTTEYKKKLHECSEGILEEFKKHVRQVREELKKLPKSSKKWWKLAKSVTSGAASKGNIPPLKSKKGEWITTPKEKSNLLLSVFTDKYKLADGEANEYTELREGRAPGVSGFLPVRARTVTKYLKQLHEDKATGPDLLSARVLKHCADELGLPVAKLTRRILNSGCWPEAWRAHWIVPLYKKKAVWDPNNYRGVHLTPQLSKVVERALGSFFMPYLEETGAYGANQFAYTKKRGCKDLLLLNSLDWVWNLHLGRKVALYCSDVKGAFDRVDTERLLHKLEAKGVSGPLLEVLMDWLQDRTAQVVVDGAFSDTAVLKNSVYQGTVWGPPLWNVFFEDARVPVNKTGFMDAFFADDLNCYKDYSKECKNELLVDEMKDCQAELHKWGRANKVQFDAGKESMHILHRSKPEGEGFEMFGIIFDTKLQMEEEIRRLANRCRWKLRTLLKSQRFFTEAELVKQYKSHILPFLEFATPAVYHATPTALEPLERVQRTFLHKLGLTAETALAKYHLAPLCTRRDMALLGVVHRAVLGKGPPQFKRWFFPAKPVPHAYKTRMQQARHDRQLHDYLGLGQTQLLRRSALGLPRVYNKLPQKIVSCTSVKEFQRALQELAKQRASKGVSNWEKTFSMKPALV